MLSDNETKELEKEISRTESSQYPPCPDNYFDDKRFVPKLLADELMGEYTFKTKDKMVYYYESGLYHPAEDLIRKICEQKLQDKMITNRYNETIFYIGSATLGNIEELPRNYINLKNGLYNLDTGKLEGHNPDYFTLTQIPVQYDPSAVICEFPLFLSQIISEDEIPIIQEWFGYCLLRDYPIHKAMMFIGDGANGKSTLINILKMFIGSRNCSKVPLQNLGDRFAAMTLYGKMVNCHADLSNAAFRNTGMFKILTGQDEISAEVKFIQRRLDFMNYAKLIFSCNKLPQVYGDDSDAFFRRWIIINFPNKFEGENADPAILNRFNDATEMAGILNWALVGLQRLMDNNTFSYSKSTNDLRRQYNRLSSPIKAFFMDKLEFDSQNHIIKKRLYADFIQYCMDEKMPVCSMEKFFKDLAQEGNCLTQRIWIDDKQEWVITGFRYKTDEEMKENKPDDSDNEPNLENYF